MCLDIATASRRSCPRIGDKWTILVVMLLGEGPMRFNELRRRVEASRNGCSHSRYAGSNGMVLSHAPVFPTIPPRVDYELTPLGHSLLTPIQHLGNWALQNIA